MGDLKKLFVLIALGALAIAFKVLGMDFMSNLVFGFAWLIIAIHIFSIWAKMIKQFSEHKKSK